MALKKRKKVLFAFVILIILVLMFSVVGIVVLYLGGTQNITTVVQDYDSPASEDIIIFEDPSLQQPVVEENTLYEEEIILEASGDNQADTGTSIELAQ